METKAIRREEIMCDGDNSSTESEQYESGDGAPTLLTAMQPDSIKDEEENTNCGLCGEPYMEDQPTASQRLRCGCCERDLFAGCFSFNQQTRPAGSRRYLSCVQAGARGLDRIKARQRRKRKQAAQAAAVTRRETVAKRKHEAEAQGAQATELKASPERTAMERAVRDILLAERSIVRRRQAIHALNGPDRDDYERDLDGESVGLESKRKALERQDKQLYDDVVSYLEVANGKVVLGERDHEQGEFDSDKPIKKQRRI